MIAKFDKNLSRGVPQHILHQCWSNGNYILSPWHQRSADVWVLRCYPRLSLSA